MENTFRKLIREVGVEHGAKETMLAQLV